MSDKFEDNLLDRIQQGNATLLDRMQYAIGAYAHGGPSGVVNDNEKAIMKRRGTNILEPTENPFTSTYKQNGKDIKVAIPRQGQDYDYQGYTAKYGEPDQSKGQHLTDEFKLPQHITFSDESVYSNKQTPGGRWQKEKGDPEYDWSYTPSAYVLKNHSPEELKQYFQKYEKRSKLNLPTTKGPVQQSTSDTTISGIVSRAMDNDNEAAWKMNLIK